MAVSRRNKAYWAERSAAQYAANARRGAASSKRVQGAYEKAIANVDKELEAWYARFAGENGVSMLEARKLLTSKELKAFQMDVEEYIARGRAVGSLPEGPAKDAWIKELENVSAKVHVSRLEAMQIRMKQQAELAGGAVDAELSQMAAAVYQDSYYHTAYDVQRGTGVGFEFAQLDSNKIDKIITTPWAADGRNFSDRVWGNTRQLVAELDSTLTVGLIQGKSLRDMSAALSERMGVAQSKAARLVTTENAYFTSAGQRDSYKALGVEEYEIVVTLDSHTSAVCQGLDGKKIAVKDLKPGATAPPFHPNCRCTTVPYFNDEFTEGEKRAARDEDDAGYELVPTDITYPEWREQFVPGMVDNQSSAATREQFDRYRERLGDLVPGTVKEFAKMKTDPEAWDRAKRQYLFVGNTDIPDGVSVAKAWELHCDVSQMRHEGFDLSVAKNAKERKSIKDLTFSGNAAIMDLDGKKYFSHSRFDDGSDIESRAYVGKYPAVLHSKKALFNTFKVPGSNVDRSFDTEAKFLEFVAAHKNPGDAFTVNIISERHICPSCAGVVEQFKKMFPNARVNVVSAKDGKDIYARKSAITKAKRGKP